MIEQYISVKAAGGTCVSNQWIRPTEWLDMPSTTDGDNVIYVLHAVFPDQPNYFAVDVDTSSGDYTVDLYNDGTAVTSYGHSVQSNFELDYTKGTGEFEERGYKQVIIKITGNMTIAMFNRRHTGESAFYDTGILSIKITSQTITNMAHSLRSQLAYFGNLEEFEWFGTCNLTDASYLFYNARSLQSVSMDLSNLDASSQSHMFYGTSIRNYDNITMPTTGVGSMQYFLSYLYSTSFTGPGARDFLRAATSLYRGFYQSITKYIGDPVNPLKLDSCTSLQQVLYAQPWVSQLYLDSTTTGNITSLNNSFVNCYRLNIVSGIDCTNVTDMTNAFLNCYSLSTLEVTNLGVSFSVHNAHFSRAGLVNIFNDLPSVTGKTITVTSNPGTGDLTTEDKAIAEDKGWTVSD